MDIKQPLLNDKQVKEKQERKKIPKLNKNENTMWKSWETLKAVLWGKSIALSSYMKILKIKKSINKWLMMQLKNLAAKKKPK